ncbi:DUF2309 domain-containing protein [Staphylococcus kloosii]|jgi:uncharacterized protein YbcC (UPF0753/DUF2309 family)|uniref:Probable inorganic carbon transporter subunit DabA n=1 Tax=Staphylococcus kloosii TaxID=29384 RepID=A0ABQ0XJK0_9STAP|nr:putative inorganic carbon transporter subunit DabA [Staphylococcus kloosii]AVQ35109.1 DUF2309 domain-containing protein [Staphylococcus kloosii]MBF7030318.1 DUF2309 family protein [Staphylococcus kloosii]PNZ08206.1 DUF2309 domain-containing protein [Staphylococcus kloosii]PTJ79819.1 DUF2309 domain-containing protein [Staphylococcus kloosii]SUM48150.1 Uncharacterized protein conserved in bacteria [Staphylococcus kloosii]
MVNTKTQSQTNQSSLTDADIAQLIEQASNVIVPLSPISIFAARHPWVNLEDKNFKHVVRWLDNTRDVDIYPGTKTIKQAYHNGEISDAILEDKLSQWLNTNDSKLSTAEKYRYCTGALKFEDLSKDIVQTVKQSEIAPVSLSELMDETHIVRSMPPRSKHIKYKNPHTYLQLLDYHVIKWCKLYLDENQSSWTLPNREQGFFYAWKKLVVHDPALSKTERQTLAALPNNPYEVIAEALTSLDIPEASRQGYLESHLLALPGWAGMLLWQMEQTHKKSRLITEYLAIRLALEWSFINPYLPVETTRPLPRRSLQTLVSEWCEWGGLAVTDWQQMSLEQQQEYLKFALAFDDKTRRQMWLEAWEETYENQLKEQLLTDNQDQLKNQVKAQLAFCIDVRSEQFRSQLENAGPFETIGIAGFYGLPIASAKLGSNHSHASLPVMNAPQHKIKEYARPHEMKTYHERKNSISALIYTFKKMKQNVLPSLLLPELTGSWLSAQMLSRTFLPRPIGRFIHKFYARWLQKPKTSLTLSHDKFGVEEGLPVGFSTQEQIEYVHQALKLMGLTESFAPLVVFCGHGSQSANNPYASSLDCGACGGAASGFNAKVLAMLCNLPEVRKGLSEAGVNIPTETVFTAAEHNTSVDNLTWIYLPTLSREAKASYEHIEQVMPQVSKQANKQRMLTLPTLKNNIAHPEEEAHRLANDWSEVRPEWGLARNASFIIAPRKLTQNKDLAGRAFLHNYDWQQDKDGSILGNIIAGPATVAQWINLQYYASTVAPHYYGSGSKTTQTVTGGIGVMQGNASDLLTGLPWQSVMKSDFEAYHAPLRLLIVIQAPNAYIEQLLDANSDFQQKVTNGWLQLASIDSDGTWQHWS